jgi:hypothetical protein
MEDPLHLSFPPLFKNGDFTGKTEYFRTLRGWKNQIK